MSTSTQQQNTCKLTDKQRDACLLMASNRTTLLEGGSRSGKTFIFLYVIVKRAIETVSHHLVTRFRFSHAKQSICYQTMPAVLAGLNLHGYVHLNKSDWFYEFPNGSTMWIGGLDEKERTEKVLGNEYATIFCNEASQVSFDSYETLLTRLNPPAGMAARMFIDYNPPNVRHWGYKIFHERKFPDGRDVPSGDFARLQMNPHDNPHLSDEYIDSLGLLSSNKRRRFLEGLYGDDSGTLWKRQWIRYQKAPEDLSRIVIGVDPSGSVGGDEIGIIVVGRKGSDYWVLDDYSLHGTPSAWSAEVAAAARRWKADAVVAEKNYGGDMVESTIRTHSPTMRVKMVSATRGKVVRAEPVSALYEQGKVSHDRPLPELEDELCMYDEDISDSPNRMDALVWAVSDLAGRKPPSGVTARSMGL